MTEPRTIPQSKRLKPKKGFDIITVKDGNGNEVRQRYAKTQSLGAALRGAFGPTKKPDSGDATGKGGSARSKAIMDEVDKDVRGK